MGLMDILNGMQNGPRGQTDPNAKGGMSPITMAILALLAYKGIKHLGAGQAPAPGATPSLAPSGGLGDILGGMLGGPGGAAGGGLGGLLQGGLGGLLAGGAAGGVLSSGLGGLLKQMQQNGQGDVAKSWVGTGQNQDISSSELAKSIGADELDALINHTGMSRDNLLSALSKALPGAVDELTPDGRIPTGEELSQRS